ncbi:MAG TPA: preprotein translocase subunit SecG [Chitinophagales bacterium]|nr:preprotein translocase subunit SecG [Chitinophagales bacterium]
MYILLTVLLILVSLFLLAIILVQNPKGGGAMGSAFGGAASNIIGVQKAENTLEKLTWGGAILLLIFAVTSTFFLPIPTTQQKSIIESGKVSEPVSVPQNAAPVMNLPSSAPTESAPEAPAE